MQLFSEKKILPPSLQIPTVIKLLIKIVSLISNKFALFIASKLFTTPISYKTPKREMGMEESAQKKSIRVDIINKDIHILSYGFSDKKVLVAHGWSGRRTQLFMIANKLLEKGFMTISFDAPSHGKSSGKQTNLVEYIATIKALYEKFGPFDAAVGHSFGGMAIANTQAQTQCFKNIVTIGSADKVSDILYNFSNNLGLNSSSGKKLIVYFERKWKLKVDDYATSHAAKKIKAPVLVVHDSMDGDVAVSSALSIRQNLQNGALLISSGLGHTKILRDKQITLRIVDFIKQNT